MKHRNETHRVDIMGRAETEEGDLFRMKRGPWRLGEPSTRAVRKHKMEHSRLLRNDKRCVNDIRRWKNY
jgi:hypothetical protein